MTAMHGMPRTGCHDNDWVADFPHNTDPYYGRTGNNTDGCQHLNAVSFLIICIVIIGHYNYQQ